MANILSESTTTIVANNRQAISNIGTSLGQAYFKPFCRGCIQGFDARKAEVERAGNVDLFFNRNIRRFRMRSADIVSVSVGTDGANNSVIYINQGTQDELVIPISRDMTQAGTVTENAVGESLKGDLSVFFKDPNKLKSVLNNYNNAELKRCEAAKKELEAAIKAIQSSIAENNQKAEKFCKEVADSAVIGVMTTENVSKDDTKPTEVTTIIVEEA